MRADDLLSGWARVVDRIARGEKLSRPAVVVGPTPELLTRFGLPAGGLIMSVGKIARCRKEHAEVPLDVWRRLPALLDDPLAIVPSARRDGSLVVLLVALDRNGDPIIVAIAPGRGGLNAVLSVYGKQAGIGGWRRSSLVPAEKGCRLTRRMASPLLCRSRQWSKPPPRHTI